MKVKPKRIYIALEGPDGVGKSTQIKLLQERLIAHNVPTFVIKEPYPTSPITPIIRNDFLSGKRSSSNIMIQSLMAAARKDMVLNAFPEIDKTVADKNYPLYVILSDRCILSAYMYTAIFSVNLRDFTSTTLIDVLHNDFTLSEFPDMIITLNTFNIDILTNRINNRNDNNTYDSESVLMNAWHNYRMFEQQGSNIEILTNLRNISHNIEISKSIDDHNYIEYSANEIHQKIVKCISNKYIPLGIDLFDEEN